jgi:hypothetical protein
MQVVGLVIRTILFALFVLGIVLWTGWSLKTWDQQAAQTGVAFLYMLQAWSLVVTPLALFALIVRPYR